MARPMSTAAEGRFTAAAEPPPDGFDAFAIDTIPGYRRARMSPVRRSLAGLLFALAATLGSFAVSGFWLQQTAFSPEHTRGAAKAVLEDTDIRNEIATLIANATAAQLPEIPPVELQARIVQIAQSDAGAALLADIIGDAHSRLIGARDTPVQVTSQELVEVVRDERAFVVPTITLEVPKVTALSIILLEGGLNTHMSTFRSGLRPGLLLATAGVAITAALVAAIAVPAMGIDWRQGLLLGAIVGSTDAAAVFSVLRQAGLRLHERIGATLEIESGLNDPMAVFLVLALVGAIAHDAGAAETAALFARQAGHVQLQGGGLFVLRHGAAGGGCCRCGCGLCQRAHQKTLQRQVGGTGGLGISGAADHGGEDHG